MRIRKLLLMMCVIGFSQIAWAQKPSLMTLQEMDARKRQLEVEADIARREVHDLRKALRKARQKKDEIAIKDIKDRLSLLKQERADGLSAGWEEIKQAQERWDRELSRQEKRKQRQELQQARKQARQALKNKRNK